MPDYPTAFRGWEDAAERHGHPILFYACVWGVLYQLLRRTAPAKLDEPTKGYWASSCVSSVHGVVITVLSWQSCVVCDLWRTPDVHVTAPVSYLTMHVFIGYIIEDFFPLLYYRNDWSSTAVYVGHHICSLVDWGACCLLGTYHRLAIPMLLCEATAPFTNGRWFLATVGGKWKTGQLYKLNGLVMTILFFITRVVLPSWLGISTFSPGERRVQYFSTHPLNYVMMTIGYFTGFGLQLFWFNQILRGLVKVLRGGSKPAASRAKAK